MSTVHSSLAYHPALLQMHITSSTKQVSLMNWAVAMPRPAPEPEEEAEDA